LNRHWIFLSPSENGPADTRQFTLSISPANANTVAGFGSVRTFSGVQELMAALKLLPYSSSDLRAIEGQMRAGNSRVDHLDISEAHFAALGLNVPG
jgi:hypothetical protein